MKEFWLIWLLTLPGCGARSPLPEGDPWSGLGGAGGEAGDAGAGGSVAGGAGQAGSGIPVDLCPSGSPPVTLISGLNWPYGIAVDGAFVYIPTYHDQGKLLRVPKQGGQPLEMKAGLDHPAQTAVDGGAIYLAVTGAGQVLQFSKDGGLSSVLASGQFSVVAVALDETHVYWLGHISGEVVRAPRAGGAPLLIASGQPSPFRLVVGPTRVYFGGSGGLRSVPKEGPSSAVVSVDSSPTRDVAVDGQHVYWTVSKPPSLRKARLDGSEQETLWELPGDSFPEAVAVDATHVYWSDAQGGAIRRIPKGGGEASLFAKAQGVPSDIALDDRCVYWSNHSITEPPDGSVVRAPK